MRKKKPLERTAAAQRVHDEMLAATKTVEKTILVDGQEVTVPVSVLPIYDPREFHKRDEVHDALNIRVAAPFGPTKRA